jgi:hypothetical protein
MYSESRCQCLCSRQDEFVGPSCQHIGLAKNNFLGIVNLKQHFPRRLFWTCTQTLLMNIRLRESFWSWQDSRESAQSLKRQLGRRPGRSQRPRIQHPLFLPSSQISNSFPLWGPARIVEWKNLSLSRGQHQVKVQSSPSASFAGSWYSETSYLCSFTALDKDTSMSKSHPMQ